MEHKVHYLVRILGLLAKLKGVLQTSLDNEGRFLLSRLQRQLYFMTGRMYCTPDPRLGPAGLRPFA